MVMPALALIAALARWWTQGSGNLYTAFAKRFYVPDPDFGWREASAHPVWLGLEAIGVVAGVLAATAVAAVWIIRRQRSARSTKALRVLAWLVSPAPLLVPLAAFASGGAPAGARESLPIGATAAAPTAGIDGGLSLPAGAYRVLAHRGTAVTVKVKAGGDDLEARFAGDPSGTWQVDPSDFARPMTAEVSVAAASVDTGIDLRTEHARKEYLLVDAHPRITFALRRLIATRQDGPALISFRALGDLGLLGKTTEIEVTGTITAADDAQRARLGLDAERAVALVQASFVLSVDKTALKVSDYDTDRFPVAVSLVLAHRP